MPKPKKNTFRTDLRPALIACALIGLILLGLLSLLALLARSGELLTGEELPYYALAFLILDLLSSGILPRYTSLAYFSVHVQKPTMK